MSIDDKLTFSEVVQSNEYGIKDTSTLRKAVAHGRFREDEVELRGKTYFVKKSALDRLYGHRKREVSNKKKSIAERAKKAQALSQATRFTHASKTRFDMKER